MLAARLFRVCVVRSRCPCCEQGPIFAGVLRCHSHCPVCQLHYDQWVGEWITPTYLASSVGMLAGFVSIAVILTTGVGLAGPLPPELLVSGVGCVAALAALRPAKTGWLAVLYWMGGVEVSARTRASLRWAADRASDPEAQLRLARAEERARSLEPPRPAPAAPPHFRSFRQLLLPETRGRPGSAPPRRRGD